MNYTSISPLRAVLNTKVLRLGLILVCLSGAILVVRAQSQNEMNAQAQDAFQKADDQLNVVYKKLLAAQPDDIAKAKLKKAQLDWIAFRDANADFAADANRGGSLAPLQYSSSQEATTKARIAELQGYLQQ